MAIHRFKQIALYLIIMGLANDKTLCFVGKQRQHHYKFTNITPTSLQKTFNFYVLGKQSVFMASKVYPFMALIG